MHRAGINSPIREKMSMTIFLPKSEVFVQMDLYVSLEALEAYAESTARTLPVTGRVSPRRVCRELDGALRALRSRERRLAGTGELTEAERWLRDNEYLAQREGAEALRAFRTAGSLRGCGEGALLPALCRVLLSVSGGVGDEERLELFLRGFQRSTILRRQELDLLPAALRAAAVERLAALYARPEPDGAEAGNLFTTLRRLSALDLGELLESQDRAAAILRQDPAGVYARMDEGSRNAYRRQVERLARRFGMPEHRVAEKAMELARLGITERSRHVGYYLFQDPLGTGRPRSRERVYIGVNLVLPLVIALLTGRFSHSAWAAALMLLPASELVKNGTDRLLLRTVPATHVPRLALEEGVPPEGKTLCVISVLLTSEDTAVQAARRLEEYRMASREGGENLLFGLLCDLPESSEAFTAGDRNRLTEAIAAVEKLNRRYGGGYYLFSRERVWSADTDRFAPWERKRGALTELCRLLVGEESRLEIGAGDPAALRGTVYVLTLDADTRLEPGTARELIGAALHPLNRPVVDPIARVVTEGSGAFHPRIDVDLSAATKTAFSRLFAPQGGGDPYGADAGEVYMDVFGSGGFAGKGLLDVRAFLDCTDGPVPEGLVLSHDAVEGALLRGALVGDASLTDGFPASPLSFYARQHRWVRGDWQNLRWLFRPGRALPAIERWRLFDSLRRSLVPAGVLAALAAALSLGDPRLLVPALAGGWILARPLTEAVMFRMFRGRGEETLRVGSGLLHGPGEVLLRPLSRLLLLAFEAQNDLSGVFTALWRLFVSKKRRLLWQTAAEGEARARGDVRAFLRQMAPAAAFGLLLLWFSPSPAGRAAGAAWMLSPLFAHSLARPKKEKTALPEEDRDWLRLRAGEIWSFFRTECRPETNYLPPDNVQEAPPAERADRISPTNLGFALLSALSALELGLATEEESLTLCGHILTAAEKMERWEGHYYNWYDTHSLAPLAPRYISTVDSGNLWACLLAAAAGLRSHGADVLAARADALRLPMDFRPLYDRKRDLFRIGMAPGDTAPARSWYDLLESEERLTGYIAVAGGQVPLRHWRRLGRAQVGFRGFRGMVSWSGTMFEYLMPELLLPLYPGSHLGESARFALLVQRTRPVGPYRLWGTSESGFASLDTSLHYRYKAHGIPRLALSRESEGERVIAPYSAFLALLCAPRAAMADLRAMERAGLLGEWGFWEAVDYTPARDPSGRGLVVRSVMAHHLGMSLAAMTDVLCGGILRKWFLSDPAMAAYTGLLAEKIPLRGALLHTRRESVPRPRRSREGEILWEGTGVDLLHPACAVLSNGAWHLTVTESGVSRARWGALTPYRSPRVPWETGHGLDLWLVTGGERIPLLPRSGDGVSWHWSFTAGEAVLTGERGDLWWSVSAAVSRQGSGERRRVALRRKKADSAAALELSFEPVLLPERDRRAHPSFGRLGLETEMEDGKLLIRRLPRGSQEEVFLSAAADRTLAVSSDLRRYPGRGGGKAFVPNTGWQSEPYITLRTVLPAGEGESSVTFALCAAPSREEAITRAGRMLREEGGFSMAQVCASQWGMELGRIRSAWERARCLFWPALARSAADTLPREREELWRLGLSGDRPILGMPCSGPGAVSAAAMEVELHGLLSLCGVDYDLVLLPGPDGDYRRAVRGEMERLLDRMGLGSTVGQAGGVHFVAPADGEVVRSAAALWAGAEGLSFPERKTDRTFVLPEPRTGSGRGPAAVLGEGESVTFTAGPALPARSWQHLLTDSRLGWLATEAGTGFMWLDNARECPLTPWQGDPLAVDGPEELLADTPEGPVSFFARPGEECSVKYDFGTAVWEKTAGGIRLRLTACLPWGSGVRLWLLETDTPCRVHWCAPLQMAPEPEDAPACRLSREGEILRAENPRCGIPDLTVSARCTLPWETVSFSSAALLTGEEDPCERSGCPALGGTFLLTREAVLLLGPGDRPELLDPAAARDEIRRVRGHWQTVLGSFRADGPEKEMLPLLNGWSAWQTVTFRLLGRTSLYQSGGAVGFRDQLQDYVNLIPLDPAGCRAHILAACAHQFAEGDVQHWWHPGSGPADKGVRTRCSDDLLWLPWAVCEYVRASGDETILAERAPYLSSPPLGAGEDSRYDTPELSQETGSVFDHALRALETVLRRGTGAHDLLKIGSGDWNDGFNAMGEAAESVWLTFFASLVCEKMAPLCPDASLGNRIRRAGEALGRAADAAWEQDRYLRGWYGDGTPLGSRKGENCRIDSLAQSFAAFCPWADRRRVRTAIDTALRELWDRERHLLRLYTPAVEPGERSPGYVASYGPGFRENGGQYTHAAVWLARACFRIGRWSDGAALLRDLALSVRQEEAGGEPWLLAADLYTAPGQQGRAGWTGYTGAAGWWWRTAWENMLGLTMERGQADLRLPAPAREAGWRAEIR